MCYCLYALGKDVPAEVVGLTFEVLLFDVVLQRNKFVLTCFHIPIVESDILRHNSRGQDTIGVGDANRYGLIEL